MFSEIELGIFFFLIAILYSSVGFGGGSSYLAILALYGFDYKVLRLTALMCNIIVVGIGTFHYLRKGWLDLKSSIPLIIGSIPFAFLGGSIKTNEKTFFIALGSILILAAILLWIGKAPLKNNKQKDMKPQQATLLSFSLGCFIGFLAGFAGIGGGIFLSPLLHFLKWDNSGKIAATSSFFILCNSVSGISGQLTQFDLIDFEISKIMILLIAVFLGSIIGSNISLKVGNTFYIRKLTSILILFVGMRLLYLNL